MTTFSRYPEVHLSPRYDLEGGTSDHLRGEDRHKWADEKQVHPFCRGG